MTKISWIQLTWILILVPGNVSGILPNITQIIVQTDSKLEMRCQLMNHDEYLNVTLKRDNVILAIGPLVISGDHRVEVSDEEQNLHIQPVTSTDSGIYVCRLGVTATNEEHQHISVSVEDFPCSPLTPIQHGEVFYAPELQDEQHVSNGTRVYYVCEDGFKLVGRNLSTCSAALRGWDAPQPFCVNETTYSVSLTPAIVSRKRLQTLGNQMDSLTREQRDMEKHLNGEVKELRSHVSSVLDTSLSAANAVEAVVERFLNRSVARTRTLKRSQVHEFYWRIPNMESEVLKNKTSLHLLSPRFYASIPGYCVQLRLYPNDKPNNLGLYAGFVPGVFDDELSWPFSGRYQLAIVSRKANVSDVAYLYTVPSDQGCSEKSFEKPVDGQPEACGFGDMMSHQDIFREPQNFLGKEGQLTIRFRLY